MSEHDNREQRIGGSNSEGGRVSQGGKIGEDFVRSVEMSEQILSYLHPLWPFLPDSESPLLAPFFLLLLLLRPSALAGMVLPGQQPRPPSLGPPAATPPARPRPRQHKHPGQGAARHGSGDAPGCGPQRHPVQPPRRSRPLVLRRGGLRAGDLK